MTNRKYKVKVFKPKLIKDEVHFSLRQLAAFALIFGAIGGYVIYRSFAAVPVLASVQAESMSLPAGASVISDSAASGGRAIKLSQNGTTSASVSLPSQGASLTVTARGNQCSGSGSPNLAVAVDNATVIAAAAVSSTSYYNYSKTVNLSGGTHNLSIDGSNLGSVTTYKGKSGKVRSTCSRVLYLDVTNFYGPDIPPPPAVPTVTLSASPASINSGGSSTLSWSSTNTTSCSAPWTGSTVTSGTQTVNPTATSSYGLTCTGAGGNVSATATVTVSTGTSVNWPASYTNGPLGAKNILPNTSNGVLLIDWFGNSGQTFSQFQTGVQQRQTDLGRKFDGIGIHYGGGGTYNGIPNCIYMDSNKQEQWVHSQGSVPIVSWSPNATLADVNSGSFDQCFVNVANYFKQYPFRIMLRQMYEFDGNWFKWTACGTLSGTPLAGSTPQSFISAWQRIVNIFKQQGATNVGFWWVPTAGYNGTCADASYPGDAYVDWVGQEAYNHDRNDVWNTPLHGGWAEFNEIINYDKLGVSRQSYQTKYGPRKPFMIGESGSKYDTAGVPSGHTVDPNRKANWFRNIASVAAPQSPYFHGIQFFDQWVSTENNDWHVDHNQPGGVGVPQGSFDATSYQGFKDMAHAAVFNSGVAGGAN